MTFNLKQRLLAESLGTGLLIIAVVGSGIMATRLTDDVAIQLLANAGATVGALIALILMFDLDTFGPATKIREGSGVWLGEVVATFGLLLVIFLISRGPRADAVPIAVGVWIGGAYWFTSSTSLANPAVTIARSLSDSFAGIAPESVPIFVVMQVIGLAVALPVIAALTTSKK